MPNLVNEKYRLSINKRQTASQDQLRLFPSCSPAVGEDSPGEPPMDSYGIAIAYPKQQQQHIYKKKLFDESLTTHTHY